MALPTTALPYGLRDVKVTPILADGSLGTAVDLPNSQTFSFEETEEFTDLRGDDRLVAIRGQGPEIAWSLESGGISLEAYSAIGGGTVTETGVTPNIQREFKKLVTDERPYFKVEGQAISDSGGDFHGVVYKCRCESIQGEFGDGEFMVQEASGRALGDDTDQLYDLIHNESETAIA